MADPDELRQQITERWERSAAGWGAQRARFQAAAAPVSHWMVQAVNPQPGQTVLELAGGPSDTGLLAAELVHPGGKLIATDVSEPMLEVAKARAAELGISGVEFKVMDAEWIDLPTASVDAVLCRWGYMLMPDPGAALRETRRVLRSEGTLALAAWTGPEDNTWSAVPRQELVRAGVMEADPDPDAPGQFAWRDPAVILEALEEAGFVDVQVTQVDFAFRYAGLDEWWDAQLDLSPGTYDAVGALTPAQRDDLRETIDARMAAHVGADGSVALPARTHVASASA